MKHTSRRLALIAGVVATVGVTAAFASTASAAEGEGAANGPRRIVQIVSNLTDDQKECLQDAGASRPGADATPEEREAAREAFRDAAETCGVTLPTGPLADLTDEQKSCLEDAGATRPEPGATFEERKAAREALVAAAEGCGIELPVRPAGGPGGNGPLADLTDEQKACLDEADLSRPGEGATQEEREAARAALQAAAETCGIELPERPEGGRPGAGNGPLADLTDEQKACLQDADLSRPGAGATQEERQAARQALQAAAEECGIELPAGPAAG